MNEIAVTAEKTEMVTMDFAAKAKEYLASMGTKLPQKHMTQFLELASAYQLNPFKREIYAVGYGENFNIITGYEVYLKRAERTGKLAGWRCEYNSQEKSATIYISRKDWANEFSHTVYDAEYNTHKSIWASKPITMLKKVAMAQGFRLCFPDELGGMPYTQDEMPEIEPINVTPKAEKNPAAILAEEFKGEVVLTAEDKKSMMNELKAIMESVDPEGHPLFTEEEKAPFRALAKKDMFKALEEAKKAKDEKVEEF